MPKKRWLVILALFVANTINYIDRVNVSVAGSEISRAFSLGPGELGIVFSCFFYIYVLLILPMGLLTDRYGARVVMTIGMFIWAIGSAATGYAGTFAELFAARLLLGVGESSSYPAGNRIVREWAPRNERGLMVAVFNAGATAGPAIGILGTSALLSHFDWRTVFYIVAAGTLAWTLVWWVFYRSPEKAPWLSSRERDHILVERDEQRAEAVKAMSLGALLKQRVMWGLLLTHGCQVYSIYLFLTWLPTYLRNVRHMDLMQSGWFGMLPYLVAAIGSIPLAALSDRLVRNQELSTGARRKLMIVLMILAASVLFVPFAESLWVLEALLIASVTFASTANGLNYALAGDLIHDKSSAGAVYGLMVLGGNSFGLLAPVLTGFIISVTGQYTQSFVLAAILLLAGIVISWTMVRRPLQPIEAPSGQGEVVPVAAS
jgi:ACS family glucarate transporter-like MFS transporter